MRSLYLAVFIIFILASCQSKEIKSGQKLYQSNKNDSLPESNSNREVDKGSFASIDTLGSTKIVKEFYNWYLEDIYGKDKESKYQPNIVKVRDLKYQLDTLAYLLAIRELVFFSDKYIVSEKEKLEKCNEAMMEMDFKEEPEAYFNDNQCGFLWSDRWLGGQGQSVDSFKIIRADQGEKESEIIVQTFGDGTEFNKIQIDLSKLSNVWKIDQIELNE